MNRYLHSIKWQAANATKTFNITEYRAMEEYHRVINCWKFTNWIKCYISASQWSVLVGGLKIGTQPLKHAQQISSINLFIHQLQRNVFNDKMEHAIKSLRFFSISLSVFCCIFNMTNCYCPSNECRSAAACTVQHVLESNAVTSIVQSPWYDRSTPR